MLPIKIVIALLLSMSCIKATAQDPVLEVIKEATKKVIRAIDLQIQRFQNNTIDLQNIQKRLENILSKLKLEEIAEWTSRQKDQYAAYFDELWRIKSYLMYYRQFQDVISKQKQLFTEYKQAVLIITQDKHFSAIEREYMYGVYGNILQASLQDISDLLSVMQSFTLQMSDAARLEMLHRTATTVDERLSALRQFNERNKMLSLQRARNEKDIKDIQKLYGL